MAPEFMPSALSRTSCFIYPYLLVRVCRPDWSPPSAVVSLQTYPFPAASHLTIQTPSSHLCLMCVWCTGTTTVWRCCTSGTYGMSLVLLSELKAL